MEKIRLGYHGYFSSVPFINLLNNAYIKKWTGAIKIEWKDDNVYEIFSGKRLEYMLCGQAYILIQDGIIKNVIFPNQSYLEFSDNKSSLDNLLLMIRAFEGIEDDIKIDARAIYVTYPDVQQFPNTLDIDANLISSYSLLAEQQSFEDKRENKDWPDVIE